MTLKQEVEKIEKQAREVARKEAAKEGEASSRELELEIFFHLVEKADINCYDNRTADGMESDTFIESLLPKKGAEDTIQLYRDAKGMLYYK